MFSTEKGRVRSTKARSPTRRRKLCVFRMSSSRSKFPPSYIICRGSAPLLRHMQREQLSRHDCNTAKLFEGRHVVVVGIGHSPVNASVNLNRCCPTVNLSIHRDA